MSTRSRFCQAIVSAFVFFCATASFAAAESKPIDVASYDHPVRVACIGDSITYGMGSGTSYPSQLQSLLGSQWKVGNFGVSGRTLLRKGDLPWRNEPAFQNAQDFQPDVVIIMLGTNDTKPYNWVHKDEFLSDYRDLVDVFAKLSSKPRVYLCRPCPVPEPGNWGINETNIQLEIAMVDKLAKEKGLGIIDMHAALADRADLFPDRVHPNTEGSRIMAQTAYVAITGKPLPPDVNSYFSDHMVLQRDAGLHVWGTAPDGEIITVEFAGQSVSGVAMDGQWLVLLEPIPASAEPRTMTISNGKGSRTIHDVLVGDVWVASGQSNMERQLGPRGGQKDIVGWKEAVAAADLPLIRQYQLPLKTSIVPLADGHGTWSVCSPETAADFCGVGFFFIRDVYESQQIPMALIHTSWGGTPAEAWTSLEQLKTVPEYAGLANQIEDLVQHPEKLQSLRQTWFEENDPGTMKSWWAEDVTTSGWKKAKAPASYEEMGIRNFDGVVWFRKEFDLPASATGKPATLCLEMIDDCDSTWVNGRLIGETDGWTVVRNYAVPADVLKPGRNVIAIRTLDTGGGGGWSAGSGELRLVLGSDADAQTVSLSGTWEHSIATPLKSGASLYLRDLNQNSPAMLYNAMIHPLLPLPIKGVIWYQGESNNDRAGDYENLFAAMIEDWRARWNCGEFPFLFVQIAPHKEMSPEIREAQRLVLARVPNTAMAVTVDVGDADDIHPARKAPVGQRLALAARALAYGEKLGYSGPLYDSMRVNADRAILKFRHIGGGLEARGGDLRGFEVAGSDGQFFPAQAKIAGETVEVRSEKVSKPVSVRYGWRNVPNVNLFNREGLPASPFTASMAGK